MKYAILIWAIIVLALTTTVNALVYDCGGTVPCFRVGNWCGAGNELYDRYYPPCNVGGDITADSNFTEGTITDGTKGETIFYDLDENGYKDLIQNNEGFMKSYYWDGQEFIEQSVQTDTYTLYDDDINLFEVDNGFTPDNNCSSESNMYIFAHNITNYFLLGMDGADFCVAGNGSLVHNSNMTRYKCFDESNRGVAGYYVCVGLVKNYTDNTSYLSYIWYDFDANTLSISTTAVSDFDMNTQVLQEPRIYQWNSGDSIMDFMFLYDGDNNGNLGFGIISGLGTTLFTKDNVSTAFTKETTESATTYHRTNLKMDYGFVDMGSAYPRIMYYIPALTPYVYVIDQSGNSVFSTKIFTDNCQAGCASGNEAVMRLLPFNCDTSSSTDDILSIISSGGSTSLPAGNWGVITCIGKTGTKVKSSGSSIGAIESSACGSGSATNQFYKSGAMTNYDGDDNYDFIAGKCVYEIDSSSLISKHLNYYTSHGFSSGNTYCTSYDFSDDGMLDFVCSGVSTTVLDILSTSMSNETGWSNNQVHYFYTNYDTCSPVCINNNITYTPNYLDDESNAVEFEIDCNGDGVYEVSTGFKSNPAEVYGVCNYTNIGYYTTRMRLTDIYHPDTYQLDEVEMSVQSVGNCYESGEWTENCARTSETIWNDSVECGDGVCDDGESSTNCPIDCLDGYTPDNEETTAYFEGCDEWDGMFSAVQPICPLWNMLITWLTHVWRWIFTAFVIFIVIVIIIGIYVVLRREKH